MLKSVSICHYNKKVFDFILDDEVFWCSDDKNVLWNCGLVFSRPWAQNCLKTASGYHMHVHVLRLLPVGTCWALRYVLSHCPRSMKVKKTDLTLYMFYISVIYFIFCKHSFSLLTLTVWAATPWEQSPSNSSAAVELPRGGHFNQSVWSDPDICRERYGRVPTANPSTYYWLFLFLWVTLQLNSRKSCLNFAFRLMFCNGVFFWYAFFKSRNCNICNSLHHHLPNFPVHCLPLLLGDENKVSLLGLGALAPLCQLITHNNKLVRRNAFMALGIMATNGASDQLRHWCRFDCSGLGSLQAHATVLILQMTL